MALLVFAALPAGPTSAAPAKDSAEAQQALNREHLGFAVALVTKGQPQLAIDQYLDPMLARFEATHAGETKRIYTARSLAETMLYMLTAAADKTAAITVDAGWSDALYWKAFALVELGQHAQARAIYEKAVVMAPSNARYINEIGYLDQQARDWPAALARFERAIAAAAVSPPESKELELARAMRGAGFALIELARLDDAEAMFRKCLALDRDDKFSANELTYIAQLRAKAGKPVPIL